METCRTLKLIGCLVSRGTCGTDLLIRTGRTLIAGTRKNALMKIALPTIVEKMTKPATCLRRFITRRLLFQFLLDGRPRPPALLLPGARLLFDSKDCQCQRGKNARAS